MIIKLKEGRNNLSREVKIAKKWEGGPSFFFYFTLCRNGGHLSSSHTDSHSSFLMQEWLHQLHPNGSPVVSQASQVVWRWQENNGNSDAYKVKLITVKTYKLPDIHIFNQRKHAQSYYLSGWFYLEFLIVTILSALT